MPTYSMPTAASVWVSALCACLAGGYKNEVRAAEMADEAVRMYKRRQEKGHFEE